MKNIFKRKAFYIAVLTSLALFFAGTYMPQDNENHEAEVLSILPQRTVIPGGHSIGVKMNVKGVLIVGLEEIKDKNGKLTNPGLKAGLQIGDSILEVNDVKVENAYDVQKEVNKSNEKVVLKVKRKNDIMVFTITPIMSYNDNRYKIGVWVKEKTAGIGTLTFYDPENNMFGALGHAITNPETGTVLSVSDGELLKSKVESVKEGKAGTPGEIRGIFYEADEALGELTKNTVYGIFGKAKEQISNPLFNRPIPVGYQEEVVEGPAFILSTLEDNRIEKYSVEIEKINHQTKADTKGLVLKVTDERLLEKSGGIVQGMSGSPIIQNNKIIGAVTHVFVNDPQKGYGIFIQWMFEESDVE